jgi:small subunit ribosomal protein S20
MDRYASTIKRHRQSNKRKARNRAMKSTMKTHMKDVKTASSKESAETALHEAIKALDKSAGAGVIHRNKAARLKSRLTQEVAARFAS